MFILKIILGLILAIAVGAIFTDNLGDGYFDFQKKAKAEAFTNKVDDISAVMQTYKISKTDTVSVVDKLGSGGSDVSMNDVVTELTLPEVKLLKGDANVDIGQLAIGSDDAPLAASGETGVYLVLVSNGADANADKISDEICEKINENIRGDDAFVTPELDLSAITPTAGDTPYDATALFAAINVADGTFIEGQTEGVCYKDSSGTGNNAFVYYVQEL